jgi:hypothetical protein
MRRRAAGTAVVAALVSGALALGGCGGDDEDTTTPTSTAGATGATGAADTGVASYDITAGDFIAGSLPDQIKAVADFVADNHDACANVDPKPGENFMQGRRDRRSVQRHRDPALGDHHSGVRAGGLS